MKQKIEHPKVFISYAWGDKDYQNQVLAFASSLVGDGVDVVIDKWNLSEGNDTYAFMEKCVTDPSITNVLMLLDPLYTKKANEHAGGVGVETQIISAQVYQKVEQDKFIPIIMKRDEHENICKPAYLEGRLHFDLSNLDGYQETYARLVKTLFGVEVYRKPELGQKPEWVDKPITQDIKKLKKYASLKTDMPNNLKKVTFINYLNQLAESIIEFSESYKESKILDQQYIELYDSSKTFRDDYLNIISYSYYVDDGYKFIADFLENTRNIINQNSHSGQISTIRIHEFFLYTIAYYMKHDSYDIVGYLLSKTYFIKMPHVNNLRPDKFKIFYSGYESITFDHIISQRDNKNYYTGTGQYWIETLAIDFCTKEELILADLICFNYSIYGKDYVNEDLWFPLLYVYNSEYITDLQVMAQKLISKEFTEKIMILFGFNQLEDFIAKFSQIEEVDSNKYKSYRYQRCFESPQMLGDFIKADQIATMK